MTDRVVVRCAQVMSGEPVFRGTRVPAGVLFENLADGMCLAEILEAWPTLDRGDCVRAIVEAGRMLAGASPEVDYPDFRRREDRPASEADVAEALAILDRAPDVPDED